MIEVGENLKTAREICRFNDFKNTAISCQSKYYFIIYSNGSIPINLQSILTEYGRLLSDDYISAARVIELGRVLAKDNAIKLIGEKLSD